MILTDNMLREKYKDYSNVHNKIKGEIKKGNLIRIKQGLYETNKNVNDYMLSGAIYGPSYLSFDFALYYYDLIPEAVYNVTCATFRKRRKKTFKTPFGTYFYRDVPDAVFPYETTIIQEGEYYATIATREKAICDKVYTLKPVKNLKEMEYLLFTDLRIDEDEFYKLNIESLKFLADIYKSTNVSYVYKLARRNNE